MMISVPRPMYMRLLWSVRDTYPRTAECTQSGLMIEPAQWSATWPPSGTSGRFSSAQRCNPPAIE